MARLLQTYSQKDRTALLPKRRVLLSTRTTTHWPTNMPRCRSSPAAARLIQRLWSSASRFTSGAAGFLTLAMAGTARCPSLGCYAVT